MTYLVEESKGVLSLYDESSNLCEFDLSRDDIYGKNSISPADIDNIEIPYTVIPVLNKEWLLKTPDELRRVSKEQLKFYMKKELAGQNIELYHTFLKEVKQGTFRYEIYGFGVLELTFGDLIKCYVINNITKESFISKMSINSIMADGKVSFRIEHNGCNYFTVYNINIGGFNEYRSAKMNILFIDDAWYCKITQYRNAVIRSLLDDTSKCVYIKLLDLFNGNAEIEYVKED